MTDLRTRRSPVPLAPFVLALALAPAAAETPPPKLPVIDGRPAVASVNGDPIALEDLAREVAAMHEGMTESAAPARKRDALALLDRLIDTRLIAQEARDSGMAEDPEFQALVAAREKEVLRDLLLRQVVAPIKADPKKVEQIFREAVREYRLRSVLIPLEADAKAFEKRLASGTAFDKAAGELVAAGKAQQGSAGDWLKESALLPEVRAAVSKLEPGQKSPVVRIGKQFTIVELVETRYPENVERRLEAQDIALDEQRRAATKAYAEKLRKANAKIDEALLTSLDLEKPGALDACRKDRRPLATIKDDPPVLVADLCNDGFDRKFYHGADQAKESKRLNREKLPVLQDLIDRKVVVREARRQGLDKTPEYRRTMALYEEGLLFTAFVKRAIAPDVKVERPDVEAFYAAHKADYVLPEQYALDVFAFKARKDADAALDKLRAGADPKWLARNAPGLLPPGAPGVPAIPPGRIPAESLPPALKQQLGGSKPGDARLHEAGEAFVVVLVREHVAAAPVPLDQIREQVANRATGEKLGRAIADTGAKLRAASDVKVFATNEQLKSLLAKNARAGG